MTTVTDKFDALKSNTTDPRTRRYLFPKKVVYTKGDVRDTKNLFFEKSNQITFSKRDLATLKNTGDGENAAIVVDFGIEFHGSLRIMIQSIRNETKRADIRVRLGESVSEVLTPFAVKNTTNDHANRDRIINVGFLSANETNESGYRFAYIELLTKDCELTLKALQGVFIYRELDYIGSFESSDSLLNRIWSTAAYTVHLCMQEFIWDGIKRDRLVWIGDTHPEVMTILTAFGDQQVVRDSLDLIRDDTAEGEWMNNISSYSFWWIIIHRELLVATGNVEYLKEQKEYLVGLINKIVGFVDEDGMEHVPEKRFLDWPNHSNDKAKHAGLHALLKMTLDAGAMLLTALGEDSLAELCKAQAQKMYRYIPDCDGSKQAAALLALSGIGDAKKINDEIISVGGAHGYSTFFGYYILAAKALAGDFAGALDDIRSYWGAMLDMGATTFWEDFDLDWVENSARIDEIVPEGMRDIHGDFGAYCYKNFRHSLCHGWASGPCPYLTRFVLGIKTLSADTYEIKPNLADLEWAKGSYPTPFGVIEVSAKKNADGTTEVEINAPENIKVIK